jgi:ferrous iron transport protein A
MEARVSKTSRIGHAKASPSAKMLQLSSNSTPCTLLQLRKGDVAILDRIDLPADDARRLMELGFLPGAPITVGQSAPGGDPRVFQVDGSEIALRRSTAAHLTVRTDSQRTM